MNWDNPLQNFVDLGQDIYDLARPYALPAYAAYQAGGDFIQNYQAYRDAMGYVYDYAAPVAAAAIGVPALPMYPGDRGATPRPTPPSRPPRLLSQQEIIDLNQGDGLVDYGYGRQIPHRSGNRPPPVPEEGVDYRGVLAWDRHQQMYGRGPLFYADVSSGAIPIYKPESALNQTHFTDYIVEGTNDDHNRRIGRCLWLHSIHIKGEITRSISYPSNLTDRQSVSYEYGLIYDRSGNDADYNASDIWESKDSGVGPAFNYGRNLSNAERFLIIYSRRGKLEWSENIAYSSSEPSKVMINEHHMLGDLMTVYKDSGSPPITGELFFYAKSDLGDIDDPPAPVPLMLNMTGRLRYYCKGPPVDRTEIYEQFGHDIPDCDLN